MRSFSNSRSSPASAACPDTRVRGQLTRGARIRAILDQPQHAPLRLADEVGAGPRHPVRAARRADGRGGGEVPRRPAGGARPARAGKSSTRSRRPASCRPRTRRTCARSCRRSRRPLRNERRMTGRLADITARIEGIHQLGAVVNAMRGIAAARAQRRAAQLVAVDSYAGDDRRRDRPRARRRAAAAAFAATAFARPALVCSSPSRASPAPSASAFSRRRTAISPMRWSFSSARAARRWPPSEA